MLFRPVSKPKQQVPVAPVSSPTRLTRRSLLGQGTVAGAAAALPLGGWAASARPVSADSRRADNGDVAILRFLAAAEILETDLWQQYTELATGNPAFMDKLSVLDEDMSDYVVQNTADEQSHASFLNAVLQSLHQAPVSLEAFRTLQGSTATGAANTRRLTNLMHLNVDTSWYLRYRSTGNPDLGATFPQAINITDRTAIPLRDNYTDTEIQAIANTAAFHFAMIEQGGSSLYDAMSLLASDVTTLRIVTSIGGAEVAHFQTWHDKAGNAVPLDTGDGLVFPDLNANPDTQTNKIMPRPCQFLSANLPLCSIIRPTSPANAGAVATIQYLTNTGLFHGQSAAFFNTLNTLAHAADRAMRDGKH